jgi:hypothetical protein
MFSGWWIIVYSGGTWEMKLHVKKVNPDFFFFTCIYGIGMKKVKAHVIRPGKYISPSPLNNKFHLQH